jgi:two-component system response regulator MtrA
VHTPSTRRALIVEDDDALAELIALALQQAGYSTVVEADGQEAVAVALSVDFDLVLLDLRLPSLDGLEVCRRVRAESAVPIIIVTSKGDTQDVVEGLDCGADDYLTKPFEVGELMARVRAAQRREAAMHGPTLVARDLEIDLATVEVRKAGEVVLLTATEFRLLVTFAQAPRQVFSREALLKQVWGYEFLGDSGMVNMAIKRLREKVEDEPSHPSLIETIRGFGYRLNP